MDAFVKFLLDYYIWILAVLGVIIVTIIGFLVDSKQKRKKKIESENSSVQQIKTVENLPNTSDENSVLVTQSIEQQNQTVVDNVIGGDGTYVDTLVNQTVQPTQSLNALDNVQTLNNNQSNLSLNEQKPHFEPREINIPISQPQINSVLTNQVPVPQPVNAVHINQPSQIQQNVPNQHSAILQSQNQNVNSQPQMLTSYVQSVPVQNMVNPVTNVQNVVSQPQPVVQQQVAPVQTPVLTKQPQSEMVMPAPLQNVVPSVQPQMQQPVEQNYTSNVAVSELVAAPNVGINFVTGEQQNDDMWKL